MMRCAYWFTSYPLRGPQRVLMLSLHVAAGDLHRIQLVAADTPGPQLLPAGGCIKGPRAATLHDGNGEWPVLVAHDQKRAVSRLRIDGHAHLLACLRGEIGGALPVLRILTRKHDVFTRGTEQFDESSRIELLGCRHERLCRLLR